MSLKSSKVFKTLFPDDPPELKRALLGQYVRNHFTSSIATPVSCILLACVLSQWESWNSIIPWLAISLISMACCHFVNNKYGDGSDVADENLDTWASIIAVPRMVFVFAWASMAWWAWTPQEPATFFIIVSLLMSTMAMNASQSGAFLPIYFMEMTPKLLAIGFVAFPIDEPLFRSIAIISLVGAGFFTKIAITVNRSNRMILKQKYQLTKAKREVEQASNAKSAFLATISHEVRTPLNGILGIINLLKYTPLNKEQDEHIETIRYSGETLLTMLNDILDYSKMEAGKVQIEQVSFDVLRLVHSVTNLMWSRAAEQQISIKYEIADNVPAFITSDPTRLRQILLNLTSNAIKFTPRGGVTVKVSLKADQITNVSYKPGDPTILRFEVSDTGIGMSPESRDILFSNFSQVDSSISRRYGGTGLGLSICKGLVELMGGHIDFISEENKGSIFWFDMPVIIASEDATLMGTDQSQKNPVIYPLDILVAEDNRINQKVIKGLLERQGHKVTIVENGQDAFEKVQNFDYDLVLMDMQMPVVDGIDGTKRIRALGGKFISLPIIALTANEMEDDIRRCSDAGMVDHIGKPIRPFVLFSTLAKHFPNKLVEESASDLDVA